MPTLDGITTCLSTVEEPELHRDLVSLGMVKGVKIDGGTVNLIIELTTPACPLKEELKNKIEKTTREIEGVTTVNVEFTSRVQATRPVSGKAPLQGVRGAVQVRCARSGDDGDLLL